MTILREPASPCCAGSATTPTTIASRVVVDMTVGAEFVGPAVAVVVKEGDPGGPRRGTRARRPVFFSKPGTNRPGRGLPPGQPVSGTTRPEKTAPDVPIVAPARSEETRFRVEP
jgi:hypothetical protein